MSNIAKLKKNPSKVLAIELLAFHPDLSLQQVADKVGVSKDCISKWKQLPEFVDAVYDRYMMQFGLEIPHVLDSMIREAKAGNVQAGRLVLEHSGKFVKNVNVTIDSPFEKFMKKIEVEQDDIEDAEVEEIIDAMPAMDTPLPERNTQDQRVRVKNERKTIKKVIKDEKKKDKYLNQRKEWYRWKKRAKAVGVKPLGAKRPTKGQRVTWQEEIIRRENEAKDS